MEKAILDKHTFSHSVLQVELYVQNYHAESGALIDKVEFFELIGDEYEPLEYDNDDVVVLRENSYDEETQTQIPATYVVNCAQNGYDSNHLVKACIYVKKPVENASMCCAREKDGCFYFERWFVDLTQYQKSLIGSIDLRCNDCDVPTATINKMLKLFAVQAAVEAQDPMLEYIYSKIACGTKTPKVFRHTSGDCHCNG